MDGILNLYKPAGPTSHDVVATVRRMSRQRRVGHAGTLDPAAAGVLLVCLGWATRLIEYLETDEKEYCATVFLGQNTDTYDATGRPTSDLVEVSLEHAEVENAVKSFQGPISQVPPLYSALKRDGQPLYRLARAGKEVELEARPVTIHRIELLAWDPPEATICLRCSKGTYVRSLAHDLGQRLGCGGHLKHLVRTAVGAFRLEDATTLEELAAAFADGYAREIAFAPDEAVSSIPAAIVSEDTAARLRNGLRWQGPSAPATTVCRAYVRDGQLVAMLENEDGSTLWRPRKVFAGDA